MKFALFLILIAQMYRAENTCLHKKNLVKVDISSTEILENHNTFCDENIKNFPNPTLAYLTPWNSEGKNIAKLYAKKIDLLCPVWYNMDFSENSYIITGENNYDSKFIDEIKQKNPTMKLIPRINLEKNALTKFLKSGGNSDEIIEKIMKYITYFAPR